MPPQLITFLIAASPIFELRGAIPMALGIYNLSPLNAFFWAVLGNILPVIFLLWLLEPLSKYLSHHNYFFNRFFAWLFERTRKNHSRQFEVWGGLALVTFVAIPLPLTGGWSGAVAAFVFDIPFKKALPLISLGVIIAGIIVTLISLSFSVI
ncbi:MAG: ligand-binding protein SH3 [Candidatus Portnoybacteria bacterium RIFCSPLOWO2_01_FULL_43_11]|uniref:Ligand-binding protein SH3 n=4 Tax=Candidatus Portnoyibacteriota TaxID=1817913 RepID=A0A1G2FBX1_9BACT|nr:MAG: ligand-binding protein SH3 [Candidatus Portnoybacteria bacterium RIFCSPHIGHO2_01_FULL_40_12b]OGZ37154.1 MAG: ligand-binding protein SH3 [Candidatus Portnoybacteria bacterium RIFCSPHIGHO2_02_FULL_40_23]OGZ37697.1 MAG: ligand-binding protein SH3 [Candidatus Portnoybacteria bacterium RIFCSPHIGHO2_12_FULL_40_11]OGZ38800.1 MAG: ligand-binding protein SH3 [Candidatus Portnoybacteria bacterium RIFCSPLOWO2_01_FULL_43_11]OGZ40389.1 MAG: ligand-binding protein SH3 [Candidatus Portnoybacteria bact